MADALPLGDANVFTVADETIANNRRQLGVMISWRENERVAKVSDDDDADITSYRGAINAGTDGGGVVCPADRSCHLQYIQLNMRCTPYTAGGPSNPLVFCPS